MNAEQKLFVPLHLKLANIEGKQPRKEITSRIKPIK